jgi:hypothetical protein
MTRALLLVGAAGVGTALWMAQNRSSEPTSRPGDPLAQAELLRAERRGELCSSNNAVGVGLRGEYFAGAPGVGEPLLVRVDASVDFDHSLDWPTDRVAQRPQSVRWSGWIKPTLTGRYRFHSTAPNSSLTVARQPLVGPDAAADASVELAAGRYYPIELIVAELPVNDKRIRLEWTAPHGARYLIPRPLLFTPTEVATAVGRQ